MSWIDRLREAEYEAPNGKSKTFKYENVSESFDRKTTSFETPDADGTYVQDLGSTSRRFPMRCFFEGADYDIDAAEFEELLRVPRGKKTVGQLTHPAYGVFDVVPFGTVTRRDDLKTAANQAIIEVTFWQTLDLFLPSLQARPIDFVFDAVREAEQAAAPEHAANVVQETTVETVSYRDRVQQRLDYVKGRLQPVADFVDDVGRTFQTTYDSINNALSTLVGDPLALAFQFQTFMSLPARARTLIENRLSGYSDLLDSVIDGLIQVPGRDSQPSNNFYSDLLVAQAAVLGAVISAVNADYRTKPQALASAEAVLALCDRLTVWRDASLGSLSLVDTGSSYQYVLSSCSSCAAFLVEISFSLDEERTITLDRARTPVDLCAEIYGTVTDEDLDFFMVSNSLVGLEFFEIPKGRSVVYFA